MKINEQESRRYRVQKVELEAPAGVDPTEYFASLFGEPTPHDEMPEPDINDEIYIIDFKKTNNDENYSYDNCTDIKQFEEYINKAIYKPKPYETVTEREYYRAVGRNLSRDYFLIAQVCLSSIIDKTMIDGSSDFYRNELHRIIDLGVFDRKYNIKLLIEINDISHEKPERKLRDQKVNLLLKKANIPLITLNVNEGRTSDGKIDDSYIIKKLEQFAKPELR